MNATEPPRPSLAVRAGRLFVIFMGPSLGGLAPLGLALDQPALAAHFGGGAEGMLQAGTIFTAPSLAIIVGAPLGGWLAERLDYRLTMLIALLLYSIAGSAGLILDGYVPLFATRLALGLAAGTVMAVYLALVGSWYEGLARAKVLGFAVASSVIVGALALKLGGNLVETGGWRAPFYLYLIGFLTLAIAWATVHGPFHKQARTASAPGAPGPLRLIAQLWPVYLVLLIISIGTFMPSAGGPFLLLAKGIKGAGDQGTILAVGSFSGVITSAGYGFLRRWFSDWVLFIVIAGSMGLGLAAVYGTVRNHGGEIRVQSQPGTGSVIKIYLPRAAAPAAGLAPGRPEDEEAVTGSGGILLVDDEEILRAVGRDLLEDLGYTVFAAADGEEALRLYAEHRDAISLAILDMIMPKMGGSELFQRLRETAPGLRVLFCTGFYREGADRELLGLGASGLIQKPYSRIELSRAVSAALGGEMATPPPSPPRVSPPSG